MKKIPIGKRVEYLIIEKNKGGTILQGSQIYCGYCGKSVGEAKRDIEEPFTAGYLLNSLKDKSVEWSIFGLYHKKCTHSLFTFRRSFDLLPLDLYMKANKKRKKEAKA
jgi:hypothetical protein